MVDEDFVGLASGTGKQQLQSTIVILWFSWDVGEKKGRLRSVVFLLLASGKLSLSQL
jgi:hypothetical protein